jgi:hypothetical protein
MQEMIQDSSIKSTVEYDWEIVSLTALLLFSRLRAGSISLPDAITEFFSAVEKARSGGDE